MTAATDALAKKKLRVYWDAPEPAGAPPREALLEGVWAALRQQHRAPAISQDERVEIRALTAADDGSVRVRLGYAFDRDVASPYDERELIDAELVLDRTGALIAIEAWTSSTAS
jgi:hypothetical protein